MQVKVEMDFSDGDGQTNRLEMDFSEMTVSFSIVIQPTEGDWTLISPMHVTVQQVKCD